MYRQQNVDATSTNIRNNSAGLDPHLETLAELLDHQILSDFALLFLNESLWSQVSGKFSAFPWNSHIKAPDNLQNLR